MADRADFTVKLTDKVSSASRSASRSLRSLGIATRDVEKSAGIFRGTAARLGGALDVFKGNLLTMGVTKMIGLASSVGQASAELLTFGQNARLAMGQLAKHGDDPARMFEHARALATRFGLDVMDTTKQYQKFLALQFSPKEGDKLMRMGADLRVLGNSAEDVQGIFMALGQIRGKGRLQGEEMLQLAERGISTELVQEEIGKILGGKSNDQVRQLQQQGKITAEVGLQAIERAIMRKLGESSLGEAGAKFADTTIDGILGRFKAVGQDVGLTALDKVAAPLTKMLGQGLDAFTGFLASPEGAATVDGIASALGRAAEMAVVLAESFGGGFGETWGVLSASASEFLGLFTGGDGTTTTALLKTLGQSLGQLAALGIGFAAALGMVAAGAVVLGGALWKLGVAAIDGLMEPLGTIVGRMLSWWDTITALWDDSSKGFIEKAWSIGKEIVLGLVNGIDELAMLPLNAIASVGTKIADKLSEVLGIHSPSRVTMELGRNVGEGLALGVEHSESRVASAGQSMASVQAASIGPQVPSMASASMWSGMPAASGMGSVSISQTFHFDGVSDPVEAGRLAARESRRELEAFFRDIAQEV